MVKNQTTLTFYGGVNEIGGKMVDCKYVHKNGGKLIMDLDFFQFAELIGIKPKVGSHLIRSISEPFSEEDIDQVMHNWLDHFKIKFHQVQASGHLSKEQLVEMVKEIIPNVLSLCILKTSSCLKNTAATCDLLRKPKSIS